MSDFVYIPSHRDLALSQLLAQFRDKPRIRSLILAIASGAQRFEDEGFGVLVSTTFSAAAGHALDVWGTFLDEPRGNLDDAPYRVILSGKILANRSDGSTPSLAAIFDLLTTPSTVRYTEAAPLFYQFTALRSTPMDATFANRVGRIMRTAKPGGIGMHLIEAVDGWYGFDDDASQGPRLQDPEPLGLDRGKLARYL